MQWAFSGGYAIDLFLNRITRKHSDIDICVFEQDRDAIVHHMLTADWRVFQFLGGGRVRRLHPGDVSESGRNLMCVKEGCRLVDFYSCEGNDVLWYVFHHTGIQCLDYMEFLFNQTQGNDMVIHSAPQITKELDKAILHHDEYPYLAPEIALLYKSSNADNPEYQQDYALALPELSEEQARWLQSALRKLYPQGHCWLNE